MNEVTTENTDRFYVPESIADEYKEKATIVTNANLDEKKYYPMLEYAPEPQHMIESKTKHLRFTVGKKYPVIEKRHEYTGCKANYGFKTLNDKEENVWVDEKYFILANSLRYEEEVGGFTPKGDNLVWDAVAEDGIVNLCDIRKMASEKNVKPLEVGNDGLKYIAENMNRFYVPEIIAMPEKPEIELVYKGEPIDVKINLDIDGLKDSITENMTLSGIIGARSTGFSHNNLWTCRKDKKPVKQSTFNEGVVKDDGNELMNNATKCMAAIDKVFGYNKIVDPDGIITAIAVNVPHLCLQWDNDVLCVSGVKTKIAYKEVQAAYSGLKGLVSVKIAERTIGKLVAGQLKKVF